jgi:hypothetical protein
MPRGGLDGSTASLSLGLTIEDDVTSVLPRRHEPPYTRLHTIGRRDWPDIPMDGLVGRPRSPLPTRPNR